MHAEGVDVCWLLDPDAQWAEIFEDGQDRRIEADGVLSSRQLPGLELPLSTIRAALAD